MSRFARRLLPSAALAGVLGLFGAAPAAHAAAPAAAPCAAYARACVSLTHHEAWLLAGGRVVYGPVADATAGPGHITPLGTYRVYRKVLHGWSTKYDMPMPFAVFFNRGVAFHEGPLNQASHGCVHLSPQDAAHFFGYLHPGDAVQVVR